MRQMRAGVVSAAVVSGVPVDVIIFGVLKAKSTAVEVRRGEVRCIIGKDSVVASDLALLFEGFSMPEYFSTQFGEHHPEAKQLQREHADWVAGSDRMIVHMILSLSLWPCTMPGCFGAFWERLGAHRINF